MLLVANDDFLKGRLHDALTGKISDAAGIILLPFLTVASCEVARRRLHIKPWGLTSGGIRLAVVFTGIVFVLVKIWSPATAAYRDATATIQWPVLAIHSFTVGGHLPDPHVVIVQDRSDLMVLPLLAIPWLVAKKRAVSN